MTPAGTQTDQARSHAARALTLVLSLALGVTLARVLYLVFVCPYDLVEDEAHYWEWSRRIDWSYYSKGPGVAWAIGLCTRLFGDFEWSVRLPAAISGGITIIATGMLARDVTRAVHRQTIGPRVVIGASLCAALCAMLAPMYQLPAILMTIDGPYVACWALACWAGWRAFSRASGAAWLALGAAIGAGFLFKYTILLLVPGLIGYALTRPRERRPRLSAGWVAGCVLITLASLAPVVIWNAQHDWVTARHLLGHLGMAGGDMPIAATSANKEHWSPAWTLEFIGAQIGMVGPLLFLALVPWRVIRRDEQRDSRQALCPDDATSFLLWCAVPIVLFYLGVSFIAEPEQNWAMAGYLTLLVLAGWKAAVALGSRAAARAGTPPRRNPGRILWTAGIIYGVVAAIGLHRADWVAAGLNIALQRDPLRGWLSRTEPDGTTIPPRPIVLGRLMGAHRIAASASLELDRIARETGQQPLVLAEHYGRASQLAFYLRNRSPAPIVLCASSILGGRETQYDVWPETDLRNPATLASLRGRPALVFTSDQDWKREQWSPLFESLTSLGKLEGEHKRDRIAYDARGFRFGAQAEGGAP